MNGPQKPSLMPVIAENIPDLLKQHDRWLCWSWTWDSARGKWNKPPFCVRGGMGKSTDPATWCSFDRALAAHRNGDFDGIGFTLGKDEKSGLNFAGFDLDRCIEGGSIRPDAVFLGGLLPSYKEYSPSALGFKVFCTGSLPAGHRKSDDRGFELYTSGRYFTVTGNWIATSPREIVDCQKELLDLYDRLYPNIPNVHTRAGRRLSEREIALDALASLSSWRAADYTCWLRVGMCLKSIADDLLSDWDAWSRQCPDKYVAGACAAKWETFRRSGVGLGSLRHDAREDGWIPPWEKTNPSAADEDDDAPEDEDAPLDPNDPHMGDGLTDEDGAGPWDMYKDDGNPPHYWLKSPIWQDSPHLKLNKGYLKLTPCQIMSWTKIRQACLVQANVYVRSDSKKKPIWDNRKDTSLLRRLIAADAVKHAPPDFDRILVAAEYVLDCSLRAAILESSQRDQLRARAVVRFDDGSVVFRARKVAALAKKDAPGITYEDLRDAAVKYGSTYWPEVEGHRLGRFTRFTSDQISKINTEISCRDPTSPHPP